MSYPRTAMTVKCIWRVPDQYTQWFFPELNSLQAPTEERETEAERRVHVHRYKTAPSKPAWFWFSTIYCRSANRLRRWHSETLISTLFLPLLRWRWRRLVENWILSVEIPWIVVFGCWGLSLLVCSLIAVLCAVIQFLTDLSVVCCMLSAVCVKYICWLEPALITTYCWHLTILWE